MCSYHFGSSLRRAFVYDYVKGQYSFFAQGRIVYSNMPSSLTFNFTYCTLRSSSQSSYKLMEYV